MTEYLIAGISMIALDGGIILGKDWENFETCDYGKENMIVIK